MIKSRNLTLRRPHKRLNASYIRINRYKQDKQILLKIFRNTFIFVVGLEVGLYGLYSYTNLLQNNKYLPKQLEEIYGKEGLINDFLANWKSYLPFGSSDASRETSIKKKETANLVEIPLEDIYVLEEGMTQDKWLHVKDILNMLYPRAQPIIKSERAEVKRLKKQKEEADKIPTPCTTLNANKEDKQESPKVIPKEKENKKPASSSSPKPSIDSKLVQDDSNTSMIKSLKQKLSNLQTTVLNSSFPFLREEKDGKKSTLTEIEDSLTKDLEQVLVEDLALVDENELKKRLVKLILEFKERSRWEAVRLSNVIEIERQKAKEITEKLLKEQEDIMNKMKEYEIKDTNARVEAELVKKLSEEYDKQREREVISFEKEKDNEIKRVRKDLINQFKQKLKSIKIDEDKKKEEVKKFYEEKVINLSKKYLQEKKEREQVKARSKFSTDVHKITTQYMNLYSKVNTNQSFKNELIALEEVSSHDFNLSKLLKKISSNCSKHGMKNKEEITKKFNLIYSDLSKQVILGDTVDEPGFFDTLLATVVSKLSFERDFSHAQSQGQKDKGLVLSKLSDEELIRYSKVKFLGNSEEQDWSTGISCLESLKSKRNKSLVKDFVKEVKENIESKEALDAINNHIIEISEQASKL